MKTFVILSLLVALVATVYSYDSKRYNLDVEAVVEDKERLRAYLDCFNDKKPCNDETRPYKEIMPEVLQQACAKCNPSQKKKLSMLIKGMKEKLPVEFGDFKKSVDPDGKLFAALEAEIAEA